MKQPKTQKEQDEMFRAYCDKQSVFYVAKTCSVSATTVRKYKDKNKWDKRIERINKKAATQNDNTEVERRVRHVKLGRVLQVAGKTKFLDAQGKLKKGVVTKMPAKTAVRAIESGIKIEREAVGEASEITERTVKFEFVTPNGEEEPKKKEKKNGNLKSN